MGAHEYIMVSMTSLRMGLDFEEANPSGTETKP